MSGPVLTSEFLIILAHSFRVTFIGDYYDVMKRSRGSVMETTSEARKNIDKIYAIALRLKTVKMGDSLKFLWCTFIFVRDGVNTERTIIQPPMMSASLSSLSLSLSRTLKMG